MSKYDFFLLLLLFYKITFILLDPLERPVFTHPDGCVQLQLQPHCEGSSGAPRSPVDIQIAIVPLIFITARALRYRKKKNFSSLLCQ